MDDVDDNNDGRRGRLQSGTMADANVVVVVVDKDRGGRGQRHVAWIKR
jgi:hypothetical protein